MTSEMDRSVVDEGVKQLWSSFHGEFPQTAFKTDGGFKAKKKKTGGKKSTLDQSLATLDQ